MKIYRIGSPTGTITYHANKDTALFEARRASIDEESEEDSDWDCETAVTEIEYRDDLSPIDLVVGLLNHSRGVYKNISEEPIVIGCFRNGQEVACEDY